jgi:hypothetical protein
MSQFMSRSKRNIQVVEEETSNKKGKSDEDEHSIMKRKIDDLSPQDDIFSANETCSLHLPTRVTDSFVHGGDNASIAHRLMPRPPDQQGRHDHVIGLLILRDKETGLLSGVIVIGAAMVPDLGICKYNQTNKDGHSMYKMSFAPKKFVDYLIAHGMIPAVFKQTGFFKSGHAIGAAKTLSIQRCAKYYSELNIPDDKVGDFFAANGAAILPQPKNLSEEQDRRLELETTIEFIKEFDTREYHSISPEGQSVTNLIRVETEVMEIADPGILELLLCYRVLESNTPKEHV